MTRMQEAMRSEGRMIATVAAALASGPMFILLHLGLTFLVSDPAILGTGAVAMMILLSILFGAAIGAIPLMIAIFLGGWMGARAAVFRHPLVWVAIGGVAGFGMVPVISGMVPGCTPAAVLTGGLVALIARRFVRWRDPVAL